MLHKWIAICNSESRVPRLILPVKLHVAKRRKSEKQKTKFSFILTVASCRRKTREPRLSFRTIARKFISPRKKRSSREIGQCCWMFFGKYKILKEGKRTTKNEPKAGRSWRRSKTGFHSLSRRSSNSGRWINIFVVYCFGLRCAAYNVGSSKLCRSWASF